MVRDKGAPLLTLVGGGVPGENLECPFAYCRACLLTSTADGRELELMIAADRFLQSD